MISFKGSVLGFVLISDRHTAALRTHKKESMKKKTHALNSSYFLHTFSIPARLSGLTLFGSREGKVDGEERFRPATLR